VGTTDVPRIDVSHLETRSQDTLLGTKGMGEGGAISPPAAITSAVADALAPVLGEAPQIRFEAAAQPVESLSARNERARDERQSAAEAAFMSDPDVQRLISQHGARLVPDSIRPLDEPH
ncbi:MAG: hypothetical protein KY442_07245, partial [Proteobacteria bacterium]|nr:hypothetical protein [Pseudomonadota bacterium]